MLDKDLVEIEQRLKPMILSALETQSWGLRIISWQFMIIPAIPTEIGLRPGFGAFYQAKDKMLGPDYYVANISGFTDPWITQEGVNEAIRDGCENLRREIDQQSILSDGHGGTQ